ncbi:hypothetical protein BK816_07940 [Boudabousia tangfeifanii]|uniref:histidine kinase n=1 Tax=Boudabousia tangfeifanii TaxID=1912795 RepID=A0A1D9MMM2_9ACTO|nr:hypothetical protein BK816_07940 [Boudabousia tangfeifanii]
MDRGRTWGLTGRPWTLRRKLVWAQTALVVLLVSLLAFTATLLLQRSMVAQVDTQLRTAQSRAAAYEPQLRFVPQAQSNPSSPSKPLPPSELEDSRPGSKQFDPKRSGKHDDLAGRVPDGLGAPGQRTGTLLVSVQSGVVKAGVITEQGTFRQLDAAQTNALTALSVSREPQTVHIPRLGPYRVLVSAVSMPADTSKNQTVSTGRFVTGLSLEPTFELRRQFWYFELALVLLGALLAVLASRFLVSRTLRPLDEVAQVAQAAAQVPMSEGKVEIGVRAPVSDPRTEVGQVGESLNTLIGHVETSLAARSASEQRLREFVADASHELRTPLASISGYTQLARRYEAELPAEVAGHLERVAAQSARMTRLVEQLLLLARLDAGRELSLAEVDLAGLAMDAVADAQAAGPDHEWSFDLELPEGGENDEELALPLVLGDADKLSQVLMNLLGNARAHTPAGTEVKVLVRPRPGAWQVLVSDNGPGIDPSELDQIFERFARSDDDAKRVEGHSGLGLSISRAIARAHQGDLTVESEPGYTVFTLTLFSLI